MHIRHIENPLHGQSREYLSSEQVEAVEDVFQDWIRDGGYWIRILFIDERRIFMITPTNK